MYDLACGSSGVANTPIMDRNDTAARNLPSTNDITEMWDLLIDLDDRDLHQQHVGDGIDVVGPDEEHKLSVWWNGSGWSYAVRDYGDAGQDRDEHAADLVTVDALRNLIAVLR